MSDNRSRHDRGGSLITHYQPTDGGESLSLKHCQMNLALQNVLYSAIFISVWFTWI
ncbi:hypothetical protein BANRA_04294 [Escherichia coli]|nr:hypothetical protein BANRA_04294 [Escherichia coli]